jgi:hypothetical protein
MPDGCGGTVECGGCSTNGAWSCVSNVCSCTPTTCAAQGKQCGSIPNGCGGTLDCGGCTSGFTCGGSGVANNCGITTTVQAGRVCSPDKLCWENPLPQGNDLNAVWTTSPTDVWAVGKSGTILHYNGTSWSGMTGLYGGVEFRGVWAASATDVWVVGASGTILRGDGTKWTKIITGVSTPDGLESVHGSSSTNVWIAGDGTYHGALQWNGSNFTFHDNLWPSPFGQNPSVFTLGPSSTWVSNFYGIRYWDGSKWTVQFPYQSGRLFGTAADNMWVSYASQCYSGCATPAFKLVGGTWVASGGSAYWDIWGTGPTDMWATDINGISHFDGSGWTALDNTSELNSGRIHGGFAVSRQGHIGRLSGSTWTDMSSRLLDYNSFVGLVGSADNNLIAASSGNGGYRWNGSSWTPMSVSSDPFMRTPTEVWSCDFSKVYRWDGTNTSTVGTPTIGISAIWASALNDAWAVGFNGSTQHWNGTSWTEVANPLSTSDIVLNGVFGTSASNVWMVGDQGQLLNWNGSAWFPATHLTYSNLRNGWASSASDAWVVGDSRALHWNGSTWTLTTDGPTGTNVSGTASNNVWVSASGGRLSRWNGSTWSDLLLGTTNNLNAVWVGSPTAVWAVGDNSTIARYRP